MSLNMARKLAIFWVVALITIGVIRGTTPEPYVDAIQACDRACRPHAFAHGNMKHFEIDQCGRPICECAP